MHITRYSALSIAVGLLLLSSLLLVELREHFAVKGPQPDLERIISTHPEGWAPVSGGLVDPKWSQSLQGSYDVVAAQTYQNVKGERAGIVMTWSRDGIHRSGHFQQYCYQVNGFTVSTPNYTVVTTAVGKQKGIAFTARYNNVIEDVMYWRITGGNLANETDTIVTWRSLLTRRFHTLIRWARYIIGETPDNLMVRISSRRSDPDQPATAHIEFIREYLTTLPASDRKLLMGQQ